jgi:hypothetical protein
MRMLLVPLNKQLVCILLFASILDRPFYAFLQLLHAKLHRPKTRHFGETLNLFETHHLLCSTIRTV